MNFNPFEKKRGDMHRIKEIAGVLVKYGFGYFVERVKLTRRLPFTKRFKQYENIEDLDSTVPERMRLVLEELGSSFIKLGQLLSTRKDFIGEEFEKEFSKLQDMTPSFSYDIVKTIIEREFGKPIDMVFSSFDEEPIASASLAQVHKAVLKNGEVVAVKVQRPDIEKQIREDIRVIRHLLVLLNNHFPDLKDHDFSMIIDEFERSIFKEIDFKQELINIKKFKMMFINDNYIFVPKVYDHYSTKYVLTMEFVDGVKVSELNKFEEDYNPKLIAKRINESFFKQIFVYGFFHADPHPGNLFILKNNVVCYFDYGMIGHIDEEFKDNLAKLFVYLINYDMNGIINQLTNMGLFDDEVDISELKYNIMDIMDIYYGTKLKDIQLGKIMNEMTLLFTRHKIKLPREMILISRAIIIIEGVSQSLDPDFNTVTVCKPYAKKIIKNKISPKKIANVFKENILSFDYFIKTFPKTMRKVLNKIASGKIDVEFEHRDLSIFSDNVERVGNKMSTAMIISALIVGSSLIMQTNKGPLLFDFPVLGIIGFCISALLGLNLIFSIIHLRKL